MQEKKERGSEILGTHPFVGKDYLEALNSSTTLKLGSISLIACFLSFSRFF